MKAGDADIIVAGVMESMSQAPHILKDARWGKRMGHGKMVDTITNDELWDVFNNYHMKKIAKNIVEQWRLTT